MVEANELTTAGIAYNLGKGIGTAVLDVGTLGILPYY